MMYRIHLWYIKW